MIKLDAKKRKSLVGLKFIDLFAGIGAFRLAFQSFGAECVFSCEWDKDAQNTYYQNYGDWPAGDITKIDEKSIPYHDILCAGFPCQPFSISGKQLGFNDTRGTLFFDIVRIVKHHKPNVIILENVKNIVSHDNGKTFNIVTNTLNRLGYDVFSDILNAACYGIPQKRERTFFVCFNKKLEIHNFNFPKVVKLKKHLIDYLLPDNLTSDFVINRNDIFFKDNVVDHYSNSTLLLGIVNKGGQGERIYSPLGVAITLSAYGGGIGAKTGLYLVNNKVRRLVPRECARIDGFPDSFKLPDNNNIAYKQLGNSIVVDVIQYIICAILDVTENGNILFQNRSNLL